MFWIKAVGSFQSHDKPLVLHDIEKDAAATNNRHYIEYVHDM